MASSTKNSSVNPIYWFALRGSNADIEKAIELLKSFVELVDDGWEVTGISSDVSELNYQKWYFCLSSGNMGKLLKSLPNLKMKGIADGGKYSHSYEEVYSRAGSSEWVSVHFFKDYEEDELPEYYWWDNDDYFELSTNADGTLCIAGFYRWDAEVEIPSEIDGVPVTSIGEKAFYRNTHIKKISIPESVTTVGKSAFSGCANLVVTAENPSVRQVLEKAKVNVVSGGESEEELAVKKDYKYSKTKNGVVITKYRGSDLEVSIPEIIDGLPVTQIGESAFVCGKDNPVPLTKVTIPASVTSIGKNAFYCPRLTEVVFAPGSKLESIGERAFFNCSIKTITLPDSLKIIGDGAFYGHSLEIVRIPADVEHIGIDAFGSRTISTFRFGDSPEYNPRQFIVDEGNCNYTSLYGALFSKDLTRLIRVPSMAEGLYSIPDGVTAIEAHAFNGCHIKHVSLPDSVRSIGDYAFYECSTLMDISIGEDSCLEKIGCNAFWSCKQLAEFRLPKGVKAIEAGTFSSCVQLKSFDAPYGFTSIGFAAFRGCRGLTSFVIPADLKNIDSSAFDSCIHLNELVIEPNSELESIGDNAFRGCESLEVVDFSNAAKLTHVGNTIFLGARGQYRLRFFKFPASVTEFEKWYGDDKESVLFFAPGIACSSIKSRDYKMNGAVGFVRGMMEGGEVSPQIAKTYYAFIKGHSREVLERLRRNIESLRWILDHGCISLADASGLAQEYADKGLTEQAAMLLEFCDAHPSNRGATRGLGIDDDNQKQKVRNKITSLNVEPFVADWYQNVRIESKAKKAITTGVRLANGEGTCSPEAFRLLVSLCYVPRSTVRDSWGEKEYLEFLEPDEFWKNTKRPVQYDINPFTGSLFEKLTKPAGTGLAIAEISSWLDPEDLSACLERLFFDEQVDSALVALCRFGNDLAIMRMTNLLAEWSDSKDRKLEKDYAIAKAALLHSRSPIAIRYFSSSWGGLDSYSLVHGTTVTALLKKYPKRTYLTIRFCDGKITDEMFTFKEFFYGSFILGDSRDWFSRANTKGEIYNGLFYFVFHEHWRDDPSQDRILNEVLSVNDIADLGTLIVECKNMFGEYGTEYHLEYDFTKRSGTYEVHEILPAQG